MVEAEGATGGNKRSKSGCGRRLLFAVIWGVVILVTLYVLFVQVENRRGAKAWKEMAAFLEAEGETIDLKELWGSKVPAAENFCAIPALQDIAVYKKEDERSESAAEKRKRLEAMSPRGGAGAVAGLGEQRLGGKAAALARPVDLDGWVRYIEKVDRWTLPEARSGAARDILEASAEFEELIDEMAAAAARAEANFDPPLIELLGDDSPFSLGVPHYNSTMKAVEGLGLRAIAAMHAGEGETAAESIVVAIRLAEAAANDRTLIGGLVAVTQMGVVLDALWEGLDARVFSVEQLERFEELLGRFRVHEMMLRSMRGEMAGMVEVMEWAKGQQLGNLVGVVESLDGGEGGSRDMASLGSMLANMMPVGWIDRNKVTIADWTYGSYIRPLKEGASLASLKAEAERLEEKAIEAKRSFHPYKIIATVSVPVYGGVSERFVYLESMLDLARVACAVERYVLERDMYPKSLDELVPDYVDAVPADQISGEPLRYLRDVEGGRCRIWSVGWDGEDDGGKRELDPVNPEGTSFHDEKYAGDWVWGYAP